MLGAYGLRTYIWNNRLKSLVLLAGFPFLLLFIAFGFALLISAMNDPSVGQGIQDAFHILPSLIPVAFGGALLWFVIAWFANQGIIDAVTGARARRAQGRAAPLQSAWRPCASAAASPCRVSGSSRPMRAMPSPPACARVSIRSPSPAG